MSTASSYCRVIITIFLFGNNPERSISWQIESFRFWRGGSRENNNQGKKKENFQRRRRKKKSENYGYGRDLMLDVYARGTKKKILEKKSAKYV